MAVRKTIRSLTISSKQLTPAGDASIPVDNHSWEGMDNLDDSIDWKYNPEKDPATFPVALDDATREHIISVNSGSPGWLLNATFRDGSAVQMSSCGFNGNLALDGDGVVELSVKGVVRWL